MDLLDAIDLFGLSIRCVDSYTGRPKPVRFRFDESVPAERRTISSGISEALLTAPYGVFREVIEKKGVETWPTVDFAGKGRGNVDASRRLMDRGPWSSDQAAINQGDRVFGDRGVPQRYLLKSRYSALAQTWIEFEDFQDLLAEEPDTVETIFSRIDSRGDRLYREVGACTADPIVNCGRNPPAHLMSADASGATFCPGAPRGQVRSETPEYPATSAQTTEPACRT